MWMWTEEFKMEFLPLRDRDIVRILRRPTPLIMTTMLSGYERSWQTFAVPECF